ncbi:fimbria/pilus periplasmic chaperone [Gallibacterium sp. AGMB14963]|uniref:fimbria/pilus periplasmic chaperone n=1 Tax=Gallibacterium faecale TaxID=3019086 RepID=UPI0022F1C8F9|nr:fimbria/pilus periplasmic chaperone [Gallibacterium sp. AGMB14963]MDA3979726.1 fimbria/pilus periplasmic chaperone [Gallibacterium sp. AGMB14963]
MFKKLLFGLLFLSNAVQANIIILGTRVIYPAQQKSVNVQLTNDSSRPALMQAWLDDGRADEDTSKIKVPFVITPPVSRMEAHTNQTIRITYTGEPLPNDRESVFYLNIMDIPPKPKAGESHNYLQFAIRSRIKLFYRPQNFTISPQQAYQKVTWSKSTINGKPALRANNLTPYYITFSNLTAGSSSIQAGMVAPFSTYDFAMNGNISGSTVKWTTINDYGGLQSGTSTLQ